VFAIAAKESLSCQNPAAVQSRPFAAWMLTSAARARCSAVSPAVLANQEVLGV